MSTVINTNLASLFAQNSLSNAQNNLATSVQRLSSGLRINSAKDDAAGLAISQNMQSQLNGTNQSIQNLNNATNLLQTADTSLSTIQDMLLRMKQLSTQGYDGSLNATQMQDVVQQLNQLNSEINATAQRTQFNGISLVASNSKVDRVNAGVYAGQYLTQTAATISSTASSVSNTMGTGVTSVTASGASLTGTNASAATYNLQLTNDDLVRKNPGTYTFRSVANQLTLSYTGPDNVPKSQTITVEAAPSDSVANKDHIQHLNFDQFGIQLDLKTTATHDTSGVLASDIAKFYQGKTFTVAGQASKITDISLQGAESGTYTFTSTSPSALNKVTTAATSSTVAGTSAITFNGLNSGDFVTVAGLTFTATTTMTNAEVASAFSNLANGAITGSGTAKGTYSGQLTGVSTGSVSNTSVVTATNSALGNGTYVNQTTTAGVTTVGSTSNGTAAVTFGAMYAGDTYTVAGLTLTASQTMTALQVAQAFAGLSDGATSGNATSLGAWTGTLTGSSTSAYAGTAVVTATLTANNTSYPTVTRSGAATAPVSQGTNNLLVSWVDSRGVSHSDSTSLLSSDFTMGSDTVINFKDAGISFNIHNYQSQTGAQIASLISTLSDPLGGNAGVLKVVNPGTSSLDFQSGPSSASFITINTLNVMTDVNGSSAGSNIQMTSVGSAMDSLSALNGETKTPVWQNAFKAASAAIDGAIDYISTQRSVFGSQMNRLSYVSTNLTAQSTNLQSSRSAIVDTNFASETATLTKGQIMQQAATAMLAQANQMPNVILSLLK